MTAEPFDTAPLQSWLDRLWAAGGTDLFLTAESAPRVRINGTLGEVPGEDVLTSEDVDRMIRTLLGSQLTERLAERSDVDFSFSWGDRARLRGNAFVQQGHLALALRMIPFRIPSLEELGLPPVVASLRDLPRGLVLVTGPTGSGKSTTLASIIDAINSTRAVHILTIEDPVEYIHRHKLAAISQREVGVDSPTFERALRSALRQDPDVLLVGEMRDLESIQIALTMAETGHLVFGTLHTNDAPQAVDRIIDVFPAERQDQIRVQLAASLAVVIAQRLLPRSGGGLCAAFEILVANSPVRNLISEGKTNQLRNIMTLNQDEGMRVLETSLAELVTAGDVEYEVALGASGHPKDLARAVGPLVANGAR